MIVAVTILLLLLMPLVADAQPPAKNVRLGYLKAGEGLSAPDEAFKAALREHGWVEGENLAIEYRFAGGKYERLRALADELVRLKVDVIFARDAPAARAAKEATATIPIVFSTPNDPVRAGLVASFARPGGNLTGMAGLGPELDRKRIEMLKDLVPSLSQAAVLVNQTNPMTAARLRETEETAKALKVQVRVVGVSNASGLEQALQTMAGARPAGLVVYEDPMFGVHQARIIEFTIKHRIPAVFSLSGWAEKGGLMEYAPDQRAMLRQAAAYVNRVLRGARPADLPIEQPTKFELVINMKTAKALGLTIPPSLLLRVHRTIQ